MFKILLALLGICSVHAEFYDVIMRYQAPKLHLRLEIPDSQVTSVLFHYGLRATQLTGRGVRIEDHWEFAVNLSTNHGDTIYAYADIYFSTGMQITTPQASIGVRRSVEEIALPFGARRIRAVTFRDDFNSYNKANWHPEISMFGGFNWEFQVYTPETKNIYAANGHLYLRPTLTTDDPRWDDNFLHNGIMDIKQIWGTCTQDGNYGCHREGKNGLLPPVMSGKVYSNPTLRFGTAEIRAKIPRGDWLWPAIWMMPKSSVYGAWPRSGEIDIMESRGNAGDLGVGTVSSTLHWGPDAGQNRWSLTHGEKHGSNYHTDFHTWRLDWTENYLKTFIDNQLILDAEVGASFWAKGGFSGANIWAGHSKAAPFDQDFFIMFNVAVGGTNGYFPDNVNWGSKKPWSNNSPNAAGDFWNGRNGWLPSWQGDNTALQIDYVEFRN